MRRFILQIKSRVMSHNLETKKDSGYPNIGHRQAGMTALRLSVALPVFVFVLASVFFYSCAGTTYESRNEQNSAVIVDISKSLPKEGLWRQNIALFDMNGDGLLDIIAPPPRKAESEKMRPFVFIQQSDGGWVEGAYRFPHLEDYNYGALSVGDINKDGQPDIVLACHGKRIIVLLNNGRGGFTEAEFPVVKDFRSRTIELADINNDGWLDIVALSEFPPTPMDGKPVKQVQGILTGINKQGNGWDVNIIREADQFFGDSLSVSDINGDGNKDLIVAPLTTIKAYKKVVWLGDGKGNFEHYSAEFIGDMLASKAGTGDVDGDGRDEIVLNLSGLGKDAEIRTSVFKLTGEGLIDISYDLKPKSVPIVFDLADIDGDHKDELSLLSMEGLHIYKYLGKAWSEIARHPIPSIDTEGAFDIKIGRQGDGSWLIAYNLGSETGNTGIRAFLLKTNLAK